MKNRIIGLISLGSLLALTLFVGVCPPARAAGLPVYTWPVAAGDDIIWWNNATGTSWYEKSHVVEINNSNPGIPFYDILFETTFKWNDSTSIWDPLYNGDTNMVTAANHTWQEFPPFPNVWGYNAAWLHYMPFLLGSEGVEIHPNIMPLMGGSVNMTWVNQSFYIYFEQALNSPVPSNLVSEISDLTWRFINTTSEDVTIYNATWTNAGILEYFEQRNDTTGDLFEKEILVTAPTISLSGMTNFATISPGTVIASTITDHYMGLGIQVVKFVWSSSSATPDWSTEGSVGTAPYQFHVPEGASGRIYLHVYANGTLGNDESAIFTFEITPGISGVPVLMIFSSIGLASTIIALRQKRNLKFNSR